jgi:hypothetical protein
LALAGGCWRGFDWINLQLEHCAGVTSRALVANSVNAAFTKAPRDK